MLLHRCKDAKTSLNPTSIIVTDVVHDHLGQFLFAGKASAIVAFSFQNSPEALHRAVINTMGDAGHALRHTGLLQLAVKIPAGILKASVTVKQGMRVRIGFYRLVKGFEYQWVIVAVTDHGGYNTPVHIGLKSR